MIANVDNIYIVEKSSFHRRIKVVSFQEVKVDPHGKWLVTKSFR